MRSKFRSIVVVRFLWDFVLLATNISLCKEKSELRSLYDIHTIKLSKFFFEGHCFEEPMKCFGDLIQKQGTA